jgi:FkbM family methyltransferase
MPRVRNALLYPVFRRVEFRGKRRLRRVLAPPAEGKVEITVGGARLRLDLSESMQRDVFYGLCDAFDRALLLSFLRGGGDFVDVGANIGLYSITIAVALGDRGRVLAIEPNAAAADQLASNLELNHCDNVIVAQCVASDAPGQKSLRVPTSGETAWSSMSAAGFDHSLVEVAATRVDDQVKQHGLRVQAVKIDVEGHELEVLAGMEQTLATRPAVLCEVNGGSTAGEVKRSLEERGYESFRVSPTRLTWLGHERAQGVFNALFVPTERLAELGSRRPRP